MSNKMLGLIIAVVVLPLAVLAQDDPCINYTMLLDDGGRSSNCSLYHPYSHDRFIDEGWRRVQLESTGEDLTMPTECVPRGYCGSHSNVWLNGTHPTVEDGIVDRMGCLSMFSSCCKVQYPIQIKNCTDFMVYNLMRTWGSDERYCFGDSNLCYQTTSTVRPTTASSTTTTTSSPTTTTLSSTSTTLSPTSRTSSPTTKSPRPTTKTQRPTTQTQRPTTETSRPTTKTQRLTTQTPRPTTQTQRPTTQTQRPITKTPRPTTQTPRPTTQTQRPTTETQRPTTKTPRPTTTRLNSVFTNRPGSHDKRSLFSDYKTDEIVTILVVCLSITIALLLVVGMFCYLRQRKVKPKFKLDSLDTKPTKA